MGALQKYIWMAVTADEYETPIAIADTAKELAYILGLSIDTVKSSELRKNSGSMSGRKIVKVLREEGGKNGLTI